MCVVYLARATNGIAPFQRFLRSCGRFPAGVEHDLVIILKGFNRDSEARPFYELIAQVGAKSVSLTDYGFDIRAYLRAAREFDSPYFCFFNSFSEILAEGWLQKLWSALNTPGIGLVGATASCESMYTNVIIERERSNHQTLFQRVWTPFRLRLCKACFYPFPNCHLRSNAILMSRETMLNVWPRRVLTKRGAYLFENGKNNLTQRVLKLNLDVRLVGKDGRSFGRGDWPSSKTFRLGNQENLLVADNQTRQYENADSETRKHLTRVAWGDGV